MRREVARRQGVRCGNGDALMGLTWLLRVYAAAAVGLQRRCCQTAPLLQRQAGRRPRRLARHRPWFLRTWAQDLGLAGG